MEEDKKRDHCPRCRQTFYQHSHISVAGYIIKQRTDRILLVKRAREPHRGLWSLPAGFCDYGELPQRAVVREVYEETGLRVIKTKLVDMSIATDDHRAPAQLILFYRAYVVEGILVNDPLENLEIGWHSISRLPPLAWESQMDFLPKTYKPFFYRRS